MNKLDARLEELVSEYARGLGLRDDLIAQMIKEMSILAYRGHNTRAELISLVKIAMVA